MTCSRSAWPARRRPRLAAGSCGLIVTAIPPLGALRPTADLSPSASCRARHRADATRCPALPGGDAASALSRLASPQVGAGLVGARAGWNRAMAGVVVPPAVQAVTARSGLRRQLPAGASLLYRGDYPEPHDERCRDDAADAQQNQHPG